MTGSYYTRANTKQYLGIDSADTTYDTQLDLFGTTANDNVEQDLYPNADAIPVVSPYLTADINALADFDVCDMFCRSIGQVKRADDYKTQRDTKLATVKASLASQFVSKVQPVAYSQPYRTDPLHTRTGL